MVDWNFFKNKRRLDVPKWLVRLNLLTYTDFSKSLIALGVKPPSESIYNALPKEEKKEEVPIEIVKAEELTPKKDPVRKSRRTRKATKTVENVDE